MVLERQREPLRPAELPDPRPGPGQVLVSVAACGVCRTDLHIVDGDLTEPKLPLVPGHQIVGTVVGAGEGAERFAIGDPGRRALARLDLRRVPLLPERAREPLRPRSLHRLRRRRRLRRAGGRRRALLLPDPGRLPRRAGGAAALRGADRLPGAAAGRRRRADRLLRLRSLRPHPLSGRRPPGAARLRLHPGGRRGDAGLRPRARRRVGRLLRGPAARGARRRDRLRPGRRPDARRAPRQRQGGTDHQRRHPHERHPRLSLRDPLGRADARLGRQPDAARTARSSWSWRRGSRSTPRSRSTR